MFLKKYLKFGFIFLLSILIIGSSHTTLYAKKKPSKKKSIMLKESHSAHKATIYSLVLPGLGQAYNKKYWKIPIIYAGFGAMVYFISSNRNEYVKFRDAYDYVLTYGAPSEEALKTPENYITPPTRTNYITAPLPESPNEYASLYSESQLKSARDLYRRNTDFSYIITGLWYLLNVVDASVDAHLFEFEVNDDLTLKIEPDIKIHPQEYKPYTGIKVSFKLPYSKH